MAGVIAEVSEDGRPVVALSRTLKLGATILFGLMGSALSPAGSLWPGPLADSGYIGFLEQIAQEKRNAAARQSQSAPDITSIDKRLGCPRDALIDTIQYLSSHAVQPAVQKAGCRRGPTVHGNLGHADPLT